MTDESKKRIQYRSDTRKQLREAKRALEQAEKELAEVKQPKTGGLRGWWNELVEPNKPRWTYLVAPIATTLQATAAFIAGCILFYPAFRNYQAIEDNNRKVREAAVVAKTEADVRFRQDEQQKQFSNVQNRLSSTDEKTRAVAMLQLAELAIREYPQLPPSSPVLKSRTMQSASSVKFVSSHYWALEFNNTNYPYFLRAVSQYAIALISEDQPLVRNAIKESIKVLSLFAKGKDEEHDALLVAMVNKLADANRTAKTNFIQSIIDLSAPEKMTRETQVALLAELVSFKTNVLGSNFMTKHILMMLLYEVDKSNTDENASSLFIWKHQAYQAVRAQDMKANNRKHVDVDAKLLSALRIAAAKLDDTRDTLARALTVLSQRAIYKAQEVKKYHKEQEEIIEVKKSLTFSLWSADNLPISLRVEEHLPRVVRALRSAESSFEAATGYQDQQLLLSDCYLAYADLRGAILTVADLRGAILTAANLSVADLTFAFLEGADLTATVLNATELAGADLYGTTVSASIVEANITALPDGVYTKNRSELEYLFDLKNNRARQLKNDKQSVKLQDKKKAIDKSK